MTVQINVNALKIKKSKTYGEKANFKFRPFMLNIIGVFYLGVLRYAISSPSLKGLLKY